MVASLIDAFWAIDLCDGRSPADPAQSPGLAARVLELYEKLLPHAQSGHIEAQYVLGVIHMLGICQPSEDEFVSEFDNEMSQAQQWLERAARQGHVSAADNLLTLGRGKLSARLSQCFEDLNKEQPQLVGESEGMPVYGTDFMTKVLERTLRGEPEVGADSEPAARSNSA